MPAVYGLMRQGLRLGLEFFFVDIASTGKDIIPGEGPVIFAANHPNSIMDTIILGTQTQRKICYLARSGLFKNPLASAFFRYFGAIPVYRTQDDPSQMGKNASMFDDAFKVLEQGGTLGIFPEGKNAPERRVLKIKTGAARIALGAEATHAYDLGVRIVPVGLNFEDRDRFLSSVLIRFGTPIEASEFADLHKEDERQAVLELTGRVQQGLEEVATHIKDDQLRDLVQDIHDIYGHRLLDEFFSDRPAQDKGLVKRFFDHVQSSSASRPPLEEHFWIKQQIADAAAWFQAQQPDLVEQVREDVRRYKAHLGQVQIRHDFLVRSSRGLSTRREAVKFTLYAVCFAPAAFFGLLGNIVPALLVLLATRKAPDEAIRAITMFATGLLAFPLVYGLQLWGVWSLSGHLWWVTLGCALALPSLGFFFLRYCHQLARYQDKILARTLFRTNRILLRVLAKERERLIDRFDALKLRFLHETSTDLKQADGS